MCLPSGGVIPRYLADNRKLIRGAAAVVWSTILWLTASVSLRVQVQNEQCQEMAQTDDQKWIKVTNNGEWYTHSVSIWSWLCVWRQCYVLGSTELHRAHVPLRFQVNLKSGTNILYWRTTGILVGGKMVKPVLLKNIQIEGKFQTPLLRYTELST